MSTTANRLCADCGIRCTGKRCQPCAARARVGVPRGIGTDSPRTRHKEPSTRDLYPIPAPSPDTSPLTLVELDQAECAGTARDVCFPEDNSTLEAKMLCHGCSIGPRCLAVALENNEAHGVWGGATQAERRNIRRNDPERWAITA